MPVITLPHQGKVILRACHRSINGVSCLFNMHYYVLRSLFRRKPIKVCLEERDTREKGSGLAESLGLADLLGYGIGCTVGAGIYSQIAIGVGVAGKYSVTCVNYSC